MIHTRKPDNIVTGIGFRALLSLVGFILEPPVFLFFAGDMISSFRYSFVSVNGATVGILSFRQDVLILSYVLSLAFVRSSN